MTEKRLNLPTLKVDISLNHRLGKTAMHLWGIPASLSAYHGARATGDKNAGA